MATKRGFRGTRREHGIFAKEGGIDEVRERERERDRGRERVY